jgi:HEAT repeat protein
VRLASVWALVTLEPENEDYVEPAVPALVGALSREEPLVRREVAELLGTIGPPAAMATEALVTALTDEDPGVRAAALYALIQVNPDYESLLAIATTMLQEPDLMARRTGAYALGRLGPQAKSAVPELKRLLRHQDPIDRTIAAWALIQIDPSDENIEIGMPLFLQNIDAESALFRQELARTFGKIGTRDPRTRQALEKLAEDEDADVQEAAQNALKQLN